MMLQNLEVRVMDAIAASGWAKPTPIQQKAIPVLLRKRNALLVAPTGSGKTEAAVIPIFVSLAASRNHSSGVSALYITPLRALNRDIFRRIITYAQREGLTADIRHGDTPLSARKRIAEKPPNILITTPETLAILLSSRRLRLHFSSLEWIVIDELHELMGSERGAHLALSLERLHKISTSNPVRVGLSATLGNLDEAARFLGGVRRPCAVLVDTSVRGYKVDCHYIYGSIGELASYVLETAPSGENQSVLVFTNTRDEAEYLAAAMKAKSPEAPVEIHHGSLSRDVREDAEAKLREGRAGIVVCTSSLELGLDIGGVNQVFQVSSPRQAVKLVQRVGRSRHRVGEDAVGQIIATRTDDELESLAIIRRVKGSSLESTKVHEGSLDVLAHHLVGMTLEQLSVSIDEALSMLADSYPFRAISMEDVDACLRLVDRQGIVRYDGRAFRRRGPKTYQYYFENISMIPEVQQFDVVDITTKKSIGRLDQIFVGEYGEPGRHFTLKGSPWKIIAVDDNKRLVHVEPAPPEITTIPYWVGELIPVEFQTAQEVGALRREILGGIGQGVSPRLKSLLEDTQQVLGKIPDDKKILIEKSKAVNSLVMHCCFGTKVNQTLATLLSTTLSSRIGYLVETRSDSYRIVLSSMVSLRPELVIETLRTDFDIEEVLSVSVVGTHPFNWKTWHVAKRFGVVSRDAQYDRRASRIIQERFNGTPLHREVLRELFHEKFDLANTKRILSEVREAKLPIEVREVSEFSALAKPVLEYVSSYAAMPLTAEKAVLELVKQRLLNIKHRLVCLSCGNWQTIIRTDQVREPISCPVCRARLVADTFVSDEDLQKVVRKKLRRMPLSKDEQRRFARAWKTSSLIQNFGKKAILVLSGYGVGSDAAARILRSITDEEELLKGIYRAEKTFVLTRGFWD